MGREKIKYLKNKIKYFIKRLNDFILKREKKWCIFP
jgi:hypothetical protein